MKLSRPLETTERGARRRPPFRLLGPSGVLTTVPMSILQSLPASFGRNALSASEESFISLHTQTEFFARRLHVWDLDIGNAVARCTIEITPFPCLLSLYYVFSL